MPGFLLKRLRVVLTLGLLMPGQDRILAAPPVLPPLNDPPTGQRLPGKFVWADFVAPDIGAARHFHRRMFG